MGPEQHPRRRIDKLGVKPGHVVAVLGLDDEAFLGELRERAAQVRTGCLARGANLVFLALDDRKGLARLANAAKSIVPDGAIWVLWPKGRAALKEDAVRAAALANGLVDIKVASFSETLSALKLVIPLAKRPGR